MWNHTYNVAIIAIMIILMILIIAIGYEAVSLNMRLTNVELQVECILSENN